MQAIFRKTTFAADGNRTTEVSFQGEGELEFIFSLVNEEFWIQVDFERGYRWRFATEVNGRMALCPEDPLSEPFNSVEQAEQDAWEKAAGVFEALEEMEELGYVQRVTEH